MHLSRVQIKNLRNFASLDLATGTNMVVVGENRVGKSNFIFALRLVLDADLPDTARQLKLADIWDGCPLTESAQVEVHLDFSNFEDDPGIVSVLTEYRLASDHTTARLSYVYRKRPEIARPPRSEADFEFLTFGGGVENRPLRNEVRRRICLDLLNALRDAEGELGRWRSSPLRPLLEQAIGKVGREELSDIAADVNAATAKLRSLEPIETLENSLRTRIRNLAGEAQDIDAKLGFAPTDPLRLFRTICLLIDGGKRGISDASLGSANLALLTLKLAEFEWRQSENERNYSFVCVEEPEAHLHPHLQRQVFNKIFKEESGANNNSLILTTHSPSIASVAPIRSIVLLKDEVGAGTKGYSLSRIPIVQAEMEDLQRYIDASRAEILFSRGVVFVEGDAEAALVPVFAKSSGFDLDEMGISICSVGGVNFSPYLKLAVFLNLPFSVVTDWDPLDGTQAPLGQKRALDLMDDVRNIRGQALLSALERADMEADANRLRDRAAEEGIFLNRTTLEIEIADTPTLIGPLLSILEAENFGATRRERLRSWKADPSAVDGEQLLAMIADVGKGRLAGRLAARTAGLAAPHYIRAAIEHVAANV